ncbi:hypothetical protein HYFRA_00010081 [Hymenoscyphus fraxineus]|uniref:Uncharacterized protein n=1 Tax=Hymenoscyphus fraxineus TaxID=746836 RepID=A0A9N9KY50_9HELO|nr:hypothetical protein HYFRA_00010081 [Hymenoscyphus fraxineus]
MSEDNRAYYSTHVLRNSKICEIDCATAEMLYFPKTTSNISRPSTIYDAYYNKTFTSPSVYMAWATVTAHDVDVRTKWISSNAQEQSWVLSYSTTDPWIAWVYCDFVGMYTTTESITSTQDKGITLTDVIQPLDLSKMSTFDLTQEFIPYKLNYETFSGEIREINSLRIEDIQNNCPTTVDKETPSTRADGSVAKEGDADYRNVLASANWSHYRCNPYIVVRETFFADWFSEPSWSTCSVKYRQRWYGMPDPPHALQFDQGLFPSTPAAPIPAPTPSPAVPVQSASPGLATITSAVGGINHPVHTNTPIVKPAPQPQDNGMPLPGANVPRPVGGGNSQQPAVDPSSNDGKPANGLDPSSPPQPGSGSPFGY